MKYTKEFFAVLCLSSSLYAQEDQQIKSHIQLLQKQSQNLQTQLNELQNKLEQKDKKQDNVSEPAPEKNNKTDLIKQRGSSFHSSGLSVHAPSTSRIYRLYPTCFSC